MTGSGMTGTGTTSYWCEQAWLPAGPVARVQLVVEAGSFLSVTAGVEPDPADERLPGLVLPGFANVHAHAFHRALRGRTHDEGGTFWTWRQRMYEVAARLDPDSYLRLATATYAEMALAGVTAVGEFHYLHHGPGGRRYDDPNAMGAALIQAADDAGVRLTLLDTCYLAGGLTPSGHTEPDAVQARFCDGTAAAWADRMAAIPGRPGLLVGAAIHSVRAVPADQIAVVAAVAAGRPLHVHLSEQPAENEACQAFYGCSPAALLNRSGALGPATTAVHATHLSAEDVDLLGRSRTAVCACPSTEADLADGIGPFAALSAAGARLCLGTDQQAHTDLLAEAGRLENDARLASGQRGRFEPPFLVNALAPQGQSALGWPDAGQLAVGQRADLVAVALDTVRTAGALPSQVVMVAGAADVRTVIRDGQVVVRDGQHRLGRVGELLAAAIEPLWADT